MKLFRKALLPVAVAAGVLGLMGALGPSAVTVSADPGDSIKITANQDGSGDGITFDTIQIGEKAYYTAVVEDMPDGTIDVDLNDQSGDTDITSLNGSNIPHTDFLDNVALKSGPNILGSSDADLAADTIAANKTAIRSYILAAIDRGENCAGPIGIQPTFCDLNAFPGHNQPNDTTNGVLLSWQDNDIDCGLTAVNGGPCAIPDVVITAVVNSLANDVAHDVGCATLAANAEAAAIAAFPTAATSTANYIGAQVEDYLVNRPVPCGDGGLYSALPGNVIPDGSDGYITVDVTCNKPGVFDLSFSISGSAKSIEVTCGDDVNTAEIFARQSSLEITPSVANVAHTLVWVELKGRDGEPAAPGTKVTFLTDRGSIESSTVDTEDEFEAASSLFGAVNALNPATAQAVEASGFATTAPDGASRQQEEVTSFSVTANSGDPIVRTVAAVILHTDPIHAPNVTPGPAVITAIIDRGSINNYLVNDNDDLVKTTTVTVVGPPAANGVTVTAAPSTVTCGEKATISVDVKDSIGQPVSDHTLVEAVTNAGGVLAGTGAVAGQAGLVTPVSSTVAETFGGKATFYLLTSTANVGKYEVVVTTGGGGGVTSQLVNGGTTTNLLGGLFTTAPISVQVTVECSVPQVAAPAQPTPSTSGPTTGQGIRPPSTGDAGLVSTESNTWVFGAAVAVVASLAIAGISVKLVREE